MSNKWWCYETDDGYVSGPFTEPSISPEVMVGSGDEVRVVTIHELAEVDMSRFVPAGSAILRSMIEDANAVVRYTEIEECDLPVSRSATLRLNALVTEAFRTWQKEQEKLDNWPLVLDYTGNAEEWERVQIGPDSEWRKKERPVGPCASAGQTASTRKR